MTHQTQNQRTVATVRRHSRGAWKVTPNYKLVRTPRGEPGPYFFPTWKRATAWADHIAQMASVHKRGRRLGRVPIATPQGSYLTPLECIAGTFEEDLRALAAPAIEWTLNQVRRSITATPDDFALAAAADGNTTGAAHA